MTYVNKKHIIKEVEIVIYGVFEGGIELIDKELFNKEVDELLEQISETENSEIKEKFNKAYELAIDVDTDSDSINRQDTHKLVSELLQYLFKNKFSSTYSVPIEFIESDIGKVLFTLKFGLAENIYFTSSLTAILGVSRNWISKASIQGLLKTSKKGKSKNLIVYERDLVKYMESRGMSKEEIESRLAQYYKLKSEGLSDEEIKEIINKK